MSQTSATQKTIVYIFGDSHCSMFNDAVFEDLRAAVAGLDGASISGLNKVVSRLEYGKHIMQLVQREPKDYYHMLKLGQVDLEFVLYYKLYVKKEIFTFHEFCQKLIEEYRHMLQKILAVNKHVVLASIHLPAYNNTVMIKDYIQRVITTGEIFHGKPKSEAEPVIDLDAFQHLDPSLRDFSLFGLTKNFMYFNDLLRDLAHELNIPFFDTTVMFLDLTTNVLKEEYQEAGHHYKNCWQPGSNTRTVLQTCFHQFFKDLNR